MSEALQRYVDVVKPAAAHEALVGRLAFGNPSADPTLDAAAAEKRAITLDEADALNGAPLDVEEAYVVRFGVSPNIDRFATDPIESADLLNAAIDRGTPVTDAELAHLNRNVRQDVDY